MIGLDTNVVLRILTGDDVRQVTAVRKLLSARHDETGAFFINQVVLAECAWALKAAYGVSKQDIATGLRTLVETPSYEIEDREIVGEALNRFEGSAADFADCLIAAKNLAAGCKFTASFDKAMQALPGVRPV